MGIRGLSEFYELGRYRFGRRIGEINHRESRLTHAGWKRLPRRRLQRLLHSFPVHKHYRQERSTRNERTQIGARTIVGTTQVDPSMPEVAHTRVDHGRTAIVARGNRVGVAL